MNNDEKKMFEFGTSLSQCCEKALADGMTKNDLVSACFGWAIGVAIQGMNWTPEQVAEHAARTAQEILSLVESQGENEPK